MNPKVSVIIPVFNGSTYIQQSIESAINQTLKDLEIIVVDDGSTDNTFHIVSQLSTNDSRIKLYQHYKGKNRGVSASRNLAISISKGDYIALLDSDDIWLPNKLELQCKILDHHKNVGIVYCRLKTLFESEYDFPEYCGLGRNDGLIEQSFIEVVTNKVWIPNSSALIRKSKIQPSIKYRNLICNEDQLFFSEILSKSDLFFIPEVFGFYRIHKESFTYNNDWKKYYFKFLIYLLLYVSINRKIQVLSKLTEHIVLKVKISISSIMNRSYSS